MPAEAPRAHLPPRKVQLNLDQSLLGLQSPIIGGWSKFCLVC